MSTTTPGETVAGHEDLLIEILLRVPVEQLIKFKSVSKQWRSLISSHRFASLHTLKNPSSIVSGLFLRRTPSEFRFLPLQSDSSIRPLFYPLNFARDAAGIKILQSCNGLLLCSSFLKVGTKRNYYVYNPTTNNFLTLPSFTYDSETAFLGVSLAFDPSKSPYYKVVCLRSTEKSMYHYQIDIYESQFRVWRNSGKPFTVPFDLIFDKGVFWNGAIHWISPRGLSLCFDLTNERLLRMSNIPVRDIWGKRRFRFFGECSGHLHLIEIYGARATRLKVFELGKDHFNWFVKYVINMDPIRAAVPGMVRGCLDTDSNYNAYVPLSLVRERNEVDASLLLHVPGKIISYNITERRIKQLVDFDSSESGSRKASLQFGWFDTYPYIATLAPVD